MRFGKTIIYCTKSTKLKFHLIDWQAGHPISIRSSLLLGASDLSVVVLACGGKTPTPAQASSGSFILDLKQEAVLSTFLMNNMLFLLFGWGLSTTSAFVGPSHYYYSAARTSVSPTATAIMAAASMDRDDGESYDLLGLPARPGRPLKVAIAGGGVGGLTAALCMLKKGMDVTVYEKTAAFARFGGPIQFASNALSVLKEIDDDFFQRIMDKFTFTGTRTCGIKDGLRADGSFRMTSDSLDYLWNKDAPPDWFVKFPLKVGKHTEGPWGCDTLAFGAHGAFHPFPNARFWSLSSQQCADLFGLPYTGVIDRPDLQEILIDECQKIKPDFLQNGNSVVSYENLGRGKGVQFQLADGSFREADVLVGSDGIWSAIRSQMYNEGGVKKSSPDKKVRQGCPYSGYTVFAGT